MKNIKLILTGAILILILLGFYFIPKIHLKLTGSVIQEVDLDEWNEHLVLNLNNASSELALILQKYSDGNYTNQDEFLVNELIPSLNLFEKSLNESYSYLIDHEKSFDVEYFKITKDEIESKLDSLIILRNATIQFT